MLLLSGIAEAAQVNTSRIKHDCIDILVARKKKKRSPKQDVLSSKPFGRAANSTAEPALLAQAFGDSCSNPIAW